MIVHVHPPSLYLDQNHWITLARARHARSKVVVPEELAAADEVIRLAEERRVRLPLSAAHVTETAAAGDGTRRQQVAATMIDLYDGWQLCNPLDVRRVELRLALQGEDPVVPAALMLSREPARLFGLEDNFRSFDPELSARDNRRINESAWRSSFEDILRLGTANASQVSASSAALDSWTSQYEVLLQWLAANPAQRDLRLVAAAKTFQDLGHESAEEAAALGLGAEQYALVMNENRIVELFQEMPLLGRTMEVTHLRLQTAEKSWEGNDLNDLHYLSCAAGYLDAVVVERHMGALLRRANRSCRPGASVHSSLREYVAALVP